MVHFLRVLFCSKLFPLKHSRGGGHVQFSPSLLDVLWYVRGEARVRSGLKLPEVPVRQKESSELRMRERKPKKKTVFVAPPARAFECVALSRIHTVASGCVRLFAKANLRIATLTVSPRQGHNEEGSVRNSSLYPRTQRM